MYVVMYVVMYVAMLLMAGQTTGPFGPKLSEVTAGTPGMVLGRPAGRPAVRLAGWPVFDAILTLF